MGMQIPQGFISVRHPCRLNRKNDAESSQRRNKEIKNNDAENKCVIFLAGFSQWRGGVSNKLFERTYFRRLMASLPVVLAEDVVACS